jgi:hypothetical protein
MKVKVFVILMVLLAFSAIAATAQPTTQRGLFFYITNGCSAPVSGFAVGDKLCLLQVGSAKYDRAIFRGTMDPGEKKFGMACAGGNGNGSVRFVPPPSTQIDAVVVTVKPNEVVSIPKTFCPRRADEAPERQLLDEP